MKVKAYKTHKITEKDTDIFQILDHYLPEIQENTVVAVTSKIVAICEGRIIATDKASKDNLVKQEADYYLPKEGNQYNVFLTIKNNIFVVTAGIDESNTEGNYILWPENPQESANKIREHLTKKHNIQSLGVIITDSRSTPLRWGVTGVAISHSGFLFLNDMIGSPDIFGKPLKTTRVNVGDSLATAAVVEMGEAGNQTPLAVITDVPYVQFQTRNPNKEEVELLHVDMNTDFFSQLLTSVPWKRGKKN